MGHTVRRDGRPGAVQRPGVSPPQLAVVCGYRNAVVLNDATPVGWVMAPAGLLAALAVR
ncbi:MAG TPA: hypothetical protein VJ622_09210 [Acidimicrobiia bacterium]|nr:hypothetical protein [Acidimicrobiia bacterium]